LKQDNSSGYTALRKEAALIAASTGRLVMRGADRRTYLQGILTNDIAALTPGTGCYAAMLTAQGRMITDMLVRELGDRIVLEVPRAQAAGVREHLERFVFSEDVEIEDATESLAEGWLYGPRALDVLKSAGAEGRIPAELHASTRVPIAGRDVTVVKGDAIGVAGYDLLTAAQDAEAVRLALAAAGALPATTADVEAVRVESGRPWFGIDMDADTIPLEAQIEDRAISRSKGCYVGQEVIVRVQDRGHGRVARRLVGLTFDSTAQVPAPAAPIRFQNRDVGRVTSAVWSPTLARPIAIGYLQRDFVEPGTRVAVGVEATVVALPFV
jgi:folate-binding protein YgfZ